jgi:hypothetical protein
MSSIIEIRQISLGVNHSSLLTAWCHSPRVISPHMMAAFDDDSSDWFTEDVELSVFTAMPDLPHGYMYGFACSLPSSRGIVSAVFRGNADVSTLSRRQVLGRRALFARRLAF